MIICHIGPPWGLFRGPHGPKKINKSPPFWWKIPNPFAMALVTSYFANLWSTVSCYECHCYARCMSCSGSLRTSLDIPPQESSHYFLDVLSGLYLIETPPRKTCNLTEDFPETLPQDLSWKISRMSAFRARKRLLFHWRGKSRRKREFLSKVYDIDLSVVAITSL